MRALLVILSLMASNFIYQWANSDPHYIIAIERSYFEATGIILYVLVNKLSRR